MRVRNVLTTLLLWAVSGYAENVSEIDSTDTSGTVTVVVTDITRAEIISSRHVAFSRTTTHLPSI
jgi:hypothetical protein